MKLESADFCSLVGMDVADTSPSIIAIAIKSPVIQNYN